MENYMLSIKRVINAPVEKVFEAWTNSEMSKHWLSPENFTTASSSMEPKIGGVFKVAMKGEDGIHTATGVVKELVPNQKLVITWVWEGHDMGDGETLITLDFKALGANSTELTLTHEMLKSEKSKAAHTHGWESTFNNLQKFLAK